MPSNPRRAGARRPARGEPFISELINMAQIYKGSWATWALTGAALVAGAGAGGCSSGTSPHEVDPGKVRTSMGLDIRDFNTAATDLTNEMLSAPRLRDEVAQITAGLQSSGQARRPLIKITQIRNDTTLKINMV